MCEQSLHRELQVWHLKRKPNLPADAFSRLELVNRLCLCFVKNFKRSIAHVEDERVSIPFVPNGGGFDAEAIAIEFDQAFIIASRERDAQFTDGIVWVGYCPS